MESSVVVALIMSGASIVVAVIAGIFQTVLVPARRLAVAEVEVSRLRAKVLALGGDPDAP